MTRGRSDGGVIVGVIIRVDYPPYGCGTIEVPQHHAPVALQGVGVEAVVAGGSDVGFWSEGHVVVTLIWVDICADAVVSVDATHGGDFREELGAVVLGEEGDGIGNLEQQESNFNKKSKQEQNLSLVTT